ncbi:MAG: hypothetical protein OXD54_08500 [Candidatus Poribacteria bacterium]|nr:hypothetical protein [Candidatus Poribacteria bacterium]
MNFFFESIQSLINLIFLIVVLGTVVISWVFADRLRKRHNADFPWNKALAIIGIEVLTWIAFNIFFEIFQANWMWISIGAIIVIFIILKRKGK